MASKFTIESTLPLVNTSLKIPRLGFGVYQSPANVCEKSCTTALKAGYRHIDTAQYYQNEEQVGDAVRNAGVPRSEVFLTTKILSAAGSVEKSYQKCVESVNMMDKGDNGYVDLFLIHSPNAGSKARKEMWLALEKLHKEGKAKAIGVSNFGVGHIKELKEYATTWPPHVNQIEEKIIVEAYSPLVRNQKANSEVLVGLAKKYGKSTAQVLVRYCLQKNWVPLPKSDTPSRIEENADVFDFDISTEDMKSLDDLDQGEAGSIVQAVKND